VHETPTVKPFESRVSFRKTDGDGDPHSRSFELLSQPATSFRGPREWLSDADPNGDNDIGWDTVLGIGSETDVAAGRSLVLQLLKQVKIGQDLSKIVLPVHILESRSMLEKLSDMFIHPELLGAIGAAETAEQRILAVCRWFISGYHMRPNGAKKPYNPILGETFECVFKEGTLDEVRYVAEQVSHHPPIMALRAIHTASQVEVVGSFVPRSKLVTPNTGASLGGGFLDIYVPRTGDRYRANWPNFYVSGVLSPPMKLELEGKIKIESRRKERAVLHFQRRGFFGGEYDHLKGALYSGDAPLPTRTITGLWHSQLMMHEHEPGAKLPTPGLSCVFFDPDVETPVRPRAPPTSLTKPSRVVWGDVTVALRNGDAKQAQLCKEELEKAEREVRRAREGRGEEYMPNYFRIVGEVKGADKNTWRYIGRHGSRAAVDSPALEASLH
jgi:hypothetical protein